ncbi:sugar phosphate isomerase/epimerase [Oceanobacillus oncorhynchi subsp. oncorhynchi]|uniref:sugar phosphate isomerase/epimerase family protein n=1 Tax=Oceanobacillus oncorhynchi TaxID=545501 RepID=UPI0031DC92DB
MGREYGLCLWPFGDIELERRLEFAQELGVDGVEVQGDITANPKELQELLKTYNLKALSVTPDNVDISSTKDEIRNQAVQYFLDLLDWAKELGSDRICLHGDVGKVAGVNSDNDWSLLVQSTKEIMQKAEELDMPVVFEVLNRYENHQVITAKEAKKLLDDVQSSHLSILLDAYHMNIEESSPVQALKEAGKDLGVYHIADSNRQAIGRGHADLKKQVEALDEIGYQGPIIMEMMAEGPNPFTPIKGENYLVSIKENYQVSFQRLKEWEAIRA